MVITKRCVKRRSLALLALSMFGVAGSIHAEPLPIADAHVHYKWSQVEVTSPDDALAALRAQKVVLAVVIGTPAEYAQRLASVVRHSWRYFQ